MMCWESLEDSEQESRKRKMIGQDEEMNDDKEKQDGKINRKSCKVTFKASCLVALNM